MNFLNKKIMVLGFLINFLYFSSFLPGELEQGTFTPPYVSSRLRYPSSSEGNDESGGKRAAFCLVERNKQSLYIAIQGLERRKELIFLPRYIEDESEKEESEKSEEEEDLAATDQLLDILRKEYEHNFDQQSRINCFPLPELQRSFSE